MTDEREFEMECAAEEAGYIPSDLVVARKSLIPPTVTDLTLSYTYQEERTTITLDRAALDLEPQHDRVDIAIRGFFPGFTITIAPSESAEQKP